MASRDLTSRVDTEAGIDEHEPADGTLSEGKSPRIHILGLGAVGKLVAHSLKGIPNAPPITLIAHKRGRVEEWRRSSQEIILEQDGRAVHRSGYDMELTYPQQRHHGLETDEEEFLFNNPHGLKPHEAAEILKQREEQQRQTPHQEVTRTLSDYESDDTIHHLIVSVKIHLTISALSSLKHRIRRSTTVCFLQNGMGIIEQVNEQVFPDPQTRPTYMMGIVSHGVNTPPRASNFFAIHAGKGTIALTTLPRSSRPETDISTPVEHDRTSRYLLRTLTRTPILCAVGQPLVEFLQQRLEKLAVNAVINPLTAVTDARNGALNFNYAFTKLTRLLLAEVSLVLRSLPELRGLPNVATRFSAARLEARVVAVARATERNVSSMLADVRAGRETEIDYINGYVLKRGEELGVSCAMNYMVKTLVEAKCKMVSNERMDEVPIGIDGIGSIGDEKPAKG